MYVSGSIIWVVTCWNDIWEVLVLNTPKGVPARNKANHFRLCESLPDKRSSMGGDVLLRFRYAWVVCDSGVNATSSEVDLWSAAEHDT